MFESVDAETIGIEGQPYVMRVSIALWPAYGCVGSFGEVSLSDLSSRFCLALLLSLYFIFKILFLFNYFYLCIYMCVCLSVCVVQELSLTFSSRDPVIRYQVVKFGSKGLYLLSHRIVPPPSPSMQ